MRKTFLAVISFFLVALSLVGIAGCSSAQSSSVSLLPAGLDSITIPDVSLQGFVYINQSQPLTVPSSYGLGTDVTVNQASAYLGTDSQSFGAVVNVAAGTDTSKITSSLPGDSSLWSLVSGNNIYVTLNSGDWNLAFQNAVKQNKTVTLASRFPEESQTFASFPATPPAKPLAAGFIDLNGGAVNSLAGQNQDVSSVLQAIKSANVNSIDFIAYGTPLAQEPAQFSTDLLKDYSVLLAGRSTYSATLLNIAFDSIVQNAGLTKTTVNNVTVYSYPVNGVSILLSHSGSVIYAAAAQSQDVAGQLLLSALNK